MDTVASLKFVKPGSWPVGEKLYDLLYTPTDGFPMSNYQLEAVHNITVHDMRPMIKDLSLDKHGFVVMDMPSQLEYEDFGNESLMRNVYAEELRETLLARLGARAVYFHECVIRKRSTIPAFENEGHGMPIPVVHTDYTLAYIHKLFDELMPERAEEIKSRRFQMLNVWKPLRGPLSDWPLALCDLRSLDARHLLGLDEVHSSDLLESQQILFDPSQTWYYLSKQTADELLVFKAADSAVPGEVPHASFENHHCPIDELPRESIEFRVLVSY